MKTLTVGSLLAMVVVIGCESIPSKTTQGAAVGSALGTATGAIIGHHYQETGAGMAVGAGLGSVAGGLAGSALETPAPAHPVPPVTTSRTPQLTKFCPIGGERYPDTFRYCPLHGAELRLKDPSTENH